MRSSLVVFASETGQQAAELMPIGFGIIAFVILMALLIVTYAFRNVGSRYRDR